MLAIWVLDQPEGYFHQRCTLPPWNMRRLNAPSYLSIIGSCQLINHGICDHIYQSLEYLSIIIIFINHGMYDYSIIMYGDTKVMMVNHGIWSDITWYGPCPKMWDLFPIFGRLSLSTPGNGAFYGTRIYKTWGIIYTSLHFPVLYNWALNWRFWQPFLGDTAVI